jgi:predicted ATPase
MHGLVTAVSISGFRSIRRSRMELGPLCALVGEPETGKSNLLLALRAVLDPAVAPGVADQARAGPVQMELEATLASGAHVRLTGRPPSIERTAEAAPPPVLYLPATLRDGTVVAEPAAAPFHGLEDGEPVLVQAFERALEGGVSGVLALIEEPELYLRPQGQRYLYRLLRRFAEAGNQVVYSTHAPTFLNAARLDEVRFVQRLPDEGTHAAGAAPVTPDQDFRVLSEFDAERSELLLARSALLVEGLTEKLALPFVFAALGLDADRDGVSIVECGGKANIPLFARVCHAAGVPCAALHDRDAPVGRRPRLSERVLNALVRDVVGEDRTIVVAPDFEGLAHLPGGERKPEQAWRRFAALRAEEMPEPLCRAARLAVDLARVRS